MSSLRIDLRLLLVLLGLMLPGAARADVFNLGEYSFLPAEGGGNAYELVVSLPASVANDKAVGWPESCRQTGESRQLVGNRARLAFTVECARPLGPADRIATPWRVDGASYTAGAAGSTATSTLSPTEAGVTLPVGLDGARPRPLPDVARDYLWQGIVHILTGWDHLAFVLCLCLLARGRTLLLLVTVFTLGHSLSLASAFFELVTVPVPPVEATIALSIAFMAREALRAREAVDGGSAARRYAIVTGGFGLLHGLGFATVLGEIGVPHHERVPGLIFFNVGVEIGQLLFVGAVLGLMAAARLAGQAPALRTAALYGAGIVSAFWLFERLAGFGFA